MYISNNDREKIIPKGQKKKNKSIILYDQICFSWGYFSRRDLVSVIGNELADLGYNITINHFPDKMNFGIFKIFVEINRSPKLIYSNSLVDKQDQVIVSKSPSDSTNEIITAIINSITEK